MERLKFLNNQISALSLAIFRIGFGLIMLVEVLRFLLNDWLSLYWSEKVFHFSYPYFEFIKPLPHSFLVALFVILSFSLIFIIFGYYYRLSSGIFFLGYAYILLLDSAQYQNHYYLILLLSLIMFVVPANCALSIDSINNPKITSSKIPFWPIFLLRFQLGIVYFFAGIQKINSDWLNAIPLSNWFEDKYTLPFLGGFISSDFGAFFFSYAGLCLDILIPFLLCFRKTRIFAFLSISLFHLLNSYIFNIGIFPWLMLFANTIFLATDWPKFLNPLLPKQVQPETKNLSRFGKALLVSYCLIQTILPLRHYFYSGVTSWTDRGHNFSWRMKLRDKAGTIHFIVKDNERNLTWEIPLKEHLKYWQIRKMKFDPTLILQFAKHIEMKLNKQGYNNISIFVESSISLNGRKPQPLINPKIDLTKIEERFMPISFIEPLRN